MNIYDKLIKKYKENVNIWINNLNYENLTTNNLNWVKKYHIEIEKLIEKKYSNLNTKKSHYTTLAKIFQLMQNVQLYEKYKKKYLNIIDEIKIEIPKQQISGNKILNWVPYDIIIKKRNELEKDTKKDPNNIFLHFQYLVLCLYTLEPPIRQEYKNMMIINRADQNDKINNFLLHTNTKSFIIINNDKVSKHYEAATFNLSNRLHKIISKSLKMFPRKYILSLITNPNSPINKQGFEKLLKSIFNDVHLSVDILRASYITEFYSHPQVSLQEKIALAKRMRHSQKTAEDFYKKVTSYPEVLRQREKLNQDNQNDNGFDLKEWSKKYQKDNPHKFQEASKKYYDANKDKVLRRKILYNLNSKNVNNPTDATIDKYKLKYHKKQKIWY